MTTVDHVILSGNLTDIAGYFPRFATRRITVHVVRRLGATRRPLEMEHGPVSLHRFVPFDVDTTNADNNVRDVRLTDVLRTMNPGRAETVGDVEVACPSAVRADNVNV